MAGTNKSYHRTTSMSSSTNSAINSCGQLEEYQQFDFYIYGPGDSEYYAQGPERTNENTTTQTRINSCGQQETYQVWNGTAGSQ